MNLEKGKYSMRCSQKRQGGFQKLLLVTGISSVFTAGAAMGSDNSPVVAGEPEGSIALAQVGGTGESSVATVIVSAQRRDESIQEVPQTVSVLGGELFEETGAGRTAAEIVRFIPSASAATLDGHGFPRWHIRGIGTGRPGASNVSPIGIYVDDVYLGSSLLTGGPVFDIERVEVLPGPQGTLWGKNSPGGAIHFISRRPSFETGGFLQTEVANYNSKRTQGAATGTLIEDRLAGRLSFSTESSDVWAKNITKGLRGSLDDSAIRGQLLARLSPNVEANLSVHYRDFSQNDQTSYTIFGPPGETDNRGVPYVRYPDRIYQLNAPHESSHYQTGAVFTLDWALADGYRLTAITGYERATHGGVSDGDTSPLEISRSYSDNEVSQWSQEIRLVSPTEQRRLSWIAGLHLFYQDIDEFSAGGSLDVPELYPGTVPAYNYSAAEHSAFSYAGFGSVNFELTEKLGLRAGVRWSRETKELEAHRERATGTVHFPNTHRWWVPGLVDSDGFVRTVEHDHKKTWNNVSWDLSLSYEILPHINSYFRVARGFKGGGFDNAATQATFAVTDAEYITSYEGGFKTQWFDGRLAFNSAVFFYDYEDIQVTIIRWDPELNNSSALLRNAGQAEVKGAEFELLAVPVRGLNVRAGFAYLDTEYVEYYETGPNGVITNDYSGNRFVRAPKYSGYVGVDYNFPLAGGVVTLGADADSRSRIFYSATAPDNPANQQAGYTLYNARVSYSFPSDRFRVTAFVDNVTDKVYTHATLPASETVNRHALGAPRTYGVSLRLNW